MNELLLQSKNDIPFIECQVNIHQPTISEISLISEETFRIGVKFLTFSKDDLSEEDRIHLQKQTDFNVFMSIMNDKTKLQYKNAVMQVLTLLFPIYRIIIGKVEIVLSDEKEMHRINNENFIAFKDIITAMFCSEPDKTDESQYNPADSLAKKIAEKLMMGRSKRAKYKGENLDKVEIFSRYVSILSIALQKDKNELMEYTVFQLIDEFKRFQLKYASDLYIKQKLAGAKDVEEVEDWMKDIHP